MSSSQAKITIRDELDASLRLNLDAPDVPAGRALLNSLDRGTVARCWPRLASALARSDPPQVNGAAANGPLPTELAVADAYEEGRRRQAEINRENEESARQRAIALKKRSDEIDAFVEAQEQAEKRREAEALEVERSERARQAAVEQSRRDDEERERQAEATADRDRTAAAIAAEQQKRQELEAKAAARQQQQAELLRQQQETLAKAQADAEATQRAAEQSNKLAQEIDRAGAERAAAEQAAERLKRPECREADRVAAEAPDLQEAGRLTSVMDLVVKLEAGMHVEACAAARKSFTAAERMRSAAARCDPVEAIPYNELASGLRDFILDQGC